MSASLRHERDTRVDRRRPRGADVALAGVSREVVAAAGIPLSRMPRCGGRRLRCRRHRAGPPGMVSRCPPRPPTAEPKHVLIGLDFEAANLQLRVKDDGRGFDTEGMLATADGHFGLLGMRERAEHCGGRLTLWSRPGEGTEVLATIPIS